MCEKENTGRAEQQGQYVSQGTGQVVGHAACRHYCLTGKLTALVFMHMVCGLSRFSPRYRSIDLANHFPFQDLSALCVQVHRRDTDLHAHRLDHGDHYSWRVGIAARCTGLFTGEVCQHFCCCSDFAVRHFLIPLQGREYQPYRLIARGSSVPVDTKTPSKFRWRPCRFADPQASCLVFDGCPVRTWASFDLPHSPQSSRSVPCHSLPSRLRPHPRLPCSGSVARRHRFLLLRER